MSDRRFLRANDHVAHVSLGGHAGGVPLVYGSTKSCAKPVTDLCAAPNGARDKQLRFGEAFEVLDQREGWAFGYDPEDGYVGYVRAETLSAPTQPTHRVQARSSTLYSRADIKSPDVMALSCGAVLTGREIEGFLQTALGFVPLQHVAPIRARVADPVAVAERLIGTPYLWGGDSAFGIDCSGLVQLVYRMAGERCPRDSDLLARHGQALPPDAPLQRGDVICWSGHVALMLDAEQMIHANAHHMAVAVEPLAEAAMRIAAKEFGDITTRRRFRA